MGNSVQKLLVLVPGIHSVRICGWGQDKFCWPTEDKQAGVHWVMFTGLVFKKCQMTQHPLKISENSKQSLRVVSSHRICLIWSRLYVIRNIGYLESLFPNSSLHTFRPGVTGGGTICSSFLHFLCSRTCFLGCPHPMAASSLWVFSFSWMALLSLGFSGCEI